MWIQSLDDGENAVRELSWSCNFLLACCCVSLGCRSHSARCSLRLFLLNILTVSKIRRSRPIRHRGPPAHIAIVSQDRVHGNRIQSRGKRQSEWKGDRAVAVRLNNRKKKFRKTYHRQNSFHQSQSPFQSRSSDYSDRILQIRKTWCKCMFVARLVQIMDSSVRSRVHEGSSK